MITKLMWGMAILLSFFLFLEEGYFVTGLFFYPVDNFISIDPNTTFADVRPVAGWPLKASVLIACAAAGATVILLFWKSIWARLTIILHIIGGKTAWVLASFLPNYDGGALGAWLTVVQLCTLVLVFRVTAPARRAADI